MDQIRQKLSEQLHSIIPGVPPHIAAPILIALITASVAILLQKSTEKDIYEPKEKHVIKVEEVTTLLADSGFF